MKNIKIRSALFIALACADIFLVSCSDKSSSSHEPSEPPSVAETVTDSTTDAEPDTETLPFESEGITFSAASGFYDSEFYLDITASEGRTVHYTLDGSTPTAESPEFTQPLLIRDISSEPNKLSSRSDIAQPAGYVSRELPSSPVDKANVVRAVAVDKDGTQSAVVTNTYFVGFSSKASYYDDVKIVSLIIDESSLFDYDTGIYVLGSVYDKWLSGDEYDQETPEWSIPANYTQKGREWERGASVQFFENGQLACSQDIGVRIHGGATRSYTQKSFNVYARKDYGAGKLRYDLFSGNVNSQTSGSPITEFDSFMLRNAGNDAMYTRFRDKLIQSLVSDRKFLTQGMEPCILFINGEYWGHYELTEKLDAAFIKAHYGVPKNDICIVKRDALDEGTDAAFAEWQALRSWIQSTDFSDEEAYSRLCSQVDMQGFIEYISTELYIDNYDWGAPNSAMWRAQTIDESNPYADGKWRFILFDTEFSTGIYERALPENDSFARLLDKDCFITDLLKAALRNEGFRKEFYDTFTDISENTFSDEKVESAIAAFSDEYREMVTDTYDRFWRDSVGGYYADSNYSFAVREVQDFFSARRKYITEAVRSGIS
ncbi:MAG: CotH kinase family protein [Ruminococcus sp.]|nr:CotH kinase family protein [Ruminococcus sp.]